MNGIHAHTGKPLSGLKHLRQSITDILKTPVGSRLMLPEYGSRLFELLDAPVNSQWKAECYAAIDTALQQWEPRFNLISTDLMSVSGGHITFDLYGEYLPDGTLISLEGILV